VKKLEDKRPLGIPRRIWGNNTKMDLKDICWNGVDSIYVAKDEDTNLAVANMVMNLRGFFEYVWYVTPFSQDDMY
jgi:hypothetical protein